MHQPLIPAGGPDPRTAAIVGNLQWMLEHPHVGDNRNAPAFHWVLQANGELIPQLLAEGKQPRIMLEYSGTLLHGLRRAGLDDIFDALRPLTSDLTCGTLWSGSAPRGARRRPSTPVQDYRLHVRAWQHHFAAIFGLEALGRVRGFSRRRWRCPTAPTWPMSSSRPSTTAATDGCWFRGTPWSCPMADRWTAPTCPTAWSPPAPTAPPPRS